MMGVNGFSTISAHDWKWKSQTFGLMWCREFVPASVVNVKTEIVDLHVKDIYETYWDILFRRHRPVRKREK